MYFRWLSCRSTALWYHHYSGQCIRIAALWVPLWFPPSPVCVPAEETETERQQSLYSNSVGINWVSGINFALIETDFSCFTFMFFLPEPGYSFLLSALVYFFSLWVEASKLWCWFITFILFVVQYLHTWCSHTHFLTHQNTLFWVKICAASSDLHVRKAKERISLMLLTHFYTHSHLNTHVHLLCHTLWFCPPVEGLYRRDLSRTESSLKDLYSL